MAVKDPICRRMRRRRYCTSTLKKGYDDLFVLRIMESSGKKIKTKKRFKNDFGVHDKLSVVLKVTTSKSS